MEVVCIVCYIVYCIYVARCCTVNGLCASGIPAVHVRYDVNVCRVYASIECLRSVHLQKVDRCHHSKFGVCVCVCVRACVLLVMVPHFLPAGR